MEEMSAEAAALDARIQREARQCCPGHLIEWCLEQGLLKDTGTSFYEVDPLLAEILKFQIGMDPVQVPVVDRPEAPPVSMDMTGRDALDLSPARILN